MNTVNILDLINPAFYPVWLTDKPNRILAGGRSSTKSSAISLRLVTDFLNDPEGNVICLRKVAKYLSTSVYEQIKWAIYMLGVGHEFKFMHSPLKIIHKQTETAFYFYGVDDPMKLKSAKIAKGYVMSVWFEEAAEYAGVSDIDMITDTFIRQKLPVGKEVVTYYSYNPPRNPYSWVNKWKDEKQADPDYFVHHSTYLDDIKGFLSAQILRKIERYKETDYDYWRWMYAGEVIGLGDNVYNMAQVKRLIEIPDDDDLIYLAFSIDSGHQVSATTCLALGFTKKRKVILLDTYYYSPADKATKKAPSELSRDIHEFIQTIIEKHKYTDRWGYLHDLPIIRLTIDSAEGALRNQYYKDYATKLHPVAKPKKAIMIDYVHDLFAQGRFFYLDIEANEVFVSEHRRYQWDTDTIDSDNPKVIKEHDHTVDAFQYFVTDNLRALDLKY